MEELKKFGRQVILDDYSVSRMADDYIAVYNKAVQKPYHILMSGYYGFHNAGDDAILNAIHRNLTQMDENLQVRVLIANPEEASQIYDYDMVSRFHIFGLLRAIHRCDLLISGGGSLLQDRTSTKSIMYYLTIINLAKLMGKKVMLYANGIGPVIKPANRRRVKRAVSRADLITLRDINSVDELRRMGWIARICASLPIRYLLLTVFRKTGPVSCWKKKVFRQKSLLWAYLLEAGIVFLILRKKWPVSAMKFTVGTTATSYLSPCRRPTIPRSAARCSSGCNIRLTSLPNRYATDKIMGMVGCADFVLCMRLHTLIFAARMHVPTLGLVYDPKVLYHLKSRYAVSGDVETLIRKKRWSWWTIWCRTEEYAKRIEEKSEEFRKTCL